MSRSIARTVVAFDVDGCLTGENDQPREDVIAALRALVPWCTVIVWSGGGPEYARMQGERLDLPPGIIYSAKTAMLLVDLCFDDQDVKLGTVNIKVGHEGKEE